MFCEQCGKRITGNVKFCGSCGSSIHEENKEGGKKEINISSSSEIKSNKDIGIIKRNPNSMAVIFLSALVILMVIFGMPIFIDLVVLAFSWNRLFKAHKNNEKESIVKIAKIISIVTFILFIAGWILSAYLFVEEVRNG